MRACLFCKIVEKKIPATIFYEDDQILVFADIEPRAPVHQLLIPKQHIASLNEIDETAISLMGHLYLTAAAMAKKLGIAETGYRVVTNCNEAGGQTVYHLHLHLLGGRAMQWPPG